EWGRVVRPQLRLAKEAAYVEPAEQQPAEVGEAIPLDGEGAELQRHRIDVGVGNLQPDNPDNQGCDHGDLRRGLRVSPRASVFGTLHPLPSAVASNSARSRLRRLDPR